MLSLSDLETLARLAGKTALRYFRNVQAERKPDRSLVTVADREIETMLRAEIAAACPDERIIGEEYGVSNPADVSAALWALDPIDGTTSFVSGLPVWGISIGRIERGLPTMGVFYLPVTDELYTVSPDTPPSCNHVPLTMFAPVAFDEESVLFVTAAAHRRYTIDFIGKSQSLGSTAAHVAFTAQGRGIAALLGHPCIWDIAGTVALIARLGGRCMYLSGLPVNFDDLADGRVTPEPMLVGHPRTLDALRPRITLRTHAPR